MAHGEWDLAKLPDLWTTAFALAQLILFWVMTRAEPSIATQTGETAPLLDQCLVVGIE
jgi:hypothetical protein